MDKKSWSRLGLVGGMLLIATFFSIPAHYFGDSWLGKQAQKHKITLGLDLAGGTELDYKIDLSDALAQNNDDDPLNDVNVNTNIWNFDLKYSLEFAPGSQLSILYRNSLFTAGNNTDLNYFENAKGMFESSLSNQLSFKLIYYLDYNAIKS